MKYEKQESVAVSSADRVEVGARCRWGVARGGMWVEGWRGGCWRTCFGLESVNHRNVVEARTSLPVCLKPICE